MKSKNTTPQQNQTSITINEPQANETAQQWVTLIDFIELRQQQKKALVKIRKNSLSKTNIKNQKNTKEKNEKSPSSQALTKLVTLLGEQLNEGHTIYTLNRINDRQRELFKTWQQEAWLTQLPTKHLDNSRVHDIPSDTTSPNVVNTPIVMQIVEQPAYLYPVQSTVGISSAPPEVAVFWLQRQWQAEKQLANQLLAIANQVQTQLSLNDAITDSPSELANTPNQEQQQAISNASRYALSIITGGPGTGKTFTVARLVAQLQHAHQQAQKSQTYLPPLSIALTAPTGKAAQRMQESLANSLNGETIALEPAKTLHRLLGIGSAGAPRYHRDNPLPYDLIIVDEASMLGLELASLLVDAIKPKSRLVLLGDANQLAAVDAGSVLADLCQVAALQPYRTELIQSKRFDENSQIGQFAKTIGRNVLDFIHNDGNQGHIVSELIHQQANKAKWQAVRQLLTLTEFGQKIALYDSQAAHPTTKLPISFYPMTAQTEFWQVYQTIAQPYQRFFDLIQSWYLAPPDIQDISIRQQLFDSYNHYRVLTAGHQGSLGSEMLNKKIAERFFRHTSLGRTLGFFYHGLPIMIKRNDYQLGLFNGDIGICLLMDGTLWVCFPDKVIPSSRLSLESCEPAYAMTIHKSQGSEFDNVAVCLDKVHSRLVSQELVYTAVTRSRGGLMIISQPIILNRAILQKGNRQTGLALQF